MRRDRTAGEPSYRRIAGAGAGRFVGERVRGGGGRLAPRPHRPASRAHRRRSLTGGLPGRPPLARAGHPLRLPGEPGRRVDGEREEAPPLADADPAGGAAGRRLGGGELQRQRARVRPRLEQEAAASEAEPRVPSVVRRRPRAAEGRLVSCLEAVNAAGSYVGGRRAHSSRQAIAPDLQGVREAVGRGPQKRKVGAARRGIPAYADGMMTAR